MRRGRRIIPPPLATSPTRGSESIIEALSEARMMSQASAISKPPPAAWPLTAAITGLSKSNISVMPANPPSTWVSSTSPAAPAFKSHPALKKRPVPVKMATRKSGSSRKDTNALLSALVVAVSMALAFGRSRRISSTCPRRSSFTMSDMMILLFSMTTAYHCIALAPN